MSSQQAERTLPISGVAPLRHAALRSANVLSAGPIFDDVLPDKGLRRGSVLVLEQSPVGITTVALSLLCGLPERTWTAWVDGDQSVSGVALAEYGVDLEHLLVVREVPVGMWSKTVATLLDAMSVVIAELHHPLSMGDARRLVARARERRAVLIVMERDGARWPAEAGVRCGVDSMSVMLGVDDVEIRGYSCEVAVNARGAPTHLHLAG